LPALVASAAIIGSVRIDQTTPGTTNGVQVVAALPAGTARIGKIQLVDSADADLTSAKGTQTSRFVGLQQAHDAGRNTRHFMLDAYTAAPLAEAVPAGKTLRLTNYTISTKSLSTVGSAVVRIRANTAGLGVLASPLVFSMECGSRAGATTVAMTGGMSVFNGVFPEGLEFPAGTGLAFSMAGYGPTGTSTLQGVTRFQVFGYEY
jgi:hypothetical protein